MTDDEGTSTEGCQHITVSEVREIDSRLHRRLTDMERNLMISSIGGYTGVALLLCYGFCRLYARLR